MKKAFGIVTDKGRFVRADLLESYAQKESQQLKDEFARKYGTKGLVAPLYNPTALAQLLELNTYHYRCCKTKARDTAGLGWTLKPLKENPSEEQYKTLDDFFSFLSEPVSTLFEKVMLDYEAIGYGAVEVIRNSKGELDDLAHIPSFTLRRHKDGERVAQQVGNKIRWFKMIGLEDDIDKDTGQVTNDPERRANEILWFCNYTPRSSLYGLPDVIPALGAVHGDISRRDYNIAFFENYGIPAAICFITGNFDPGEVDEEGRTELEKSIGQQLEEFSKKPFSTLIQGIQTLGHEGDIKIEFQPLGVETKEASFRLYRKDNRDEVLAAHGVPGYRAGISEEGALGGSIAKEATEIYKRSVIEPRQEMLESALNRYLLWGELEATDWQFKFAEIDTSDERHDLDIIKGLFDLGAITPNQVIQHFGDRFGLEAVEYEPLMDAHYINGQPVEIQTAPEVEEVMRRVKRLFDVE